MVRGKKSQLHIKCTRRHKQTNNKKREQQQFANFCNWLEAKETAAETQKETATLWGKSARQVKMKNSSSLCSYLGCTKK